MSISYLTPSFLDILIQEFIKLKKNLTDKKLLDNSTYKKLSILGDKIMASKNLSFPKADWRTAMFPNEQLGKTPEWAGKNGHRLRIAIHRENGTVKMKLPNNWPPKMVKAFSRMYPLPHPGPRKYRVLRFRKVSDGIYKYKEVKASPNKPSTPPSTWHTGDKNSATLVRYFPVTRKEGRGKCKEGRGKWRSNWGEHDIRFRGHNGRLLRLFYNKKTLEISRMEPDNWSKKQIDAFNYIYPNGHDSLPVSTKQKRIRSIVENWHGVPEWLTKNGVKPLVRRFGLSMYSDNMQREQAALIAKLVKAPTGGESKDGAEDPEEAAKIAEAKAAAEAAAKATAKAVEEAKALEEEKEEIPLLDTELKTLLWIQKTVDEHIDNLKQKLAKAEASSKKLKDKIKKKQKEQKKERKEKRRKRMTELSAELERLKRLNEEDEDSSDEEPDFPGVWSVEGWSHKSLEQWEDVDFYIDEENNVWDENMAFVGIYKGWSDTISFKEDYEPEE